MIIMKHALSTILAVVICALTSTVVHAQPKPEIHVQRGHSDNISAVCFTPDGKYFLSSSWDNSIILWDASTGKEVRSFISTRVLGMAVSPDGKQILSGHLDGLVRLWNIETGELIRVFRGHTDLVWCVAFSPDGRLAASASQDKTIRIWVVATGGEDNLITNLSGDALSLAFSPDGTLLASGGKSGLALWDVQSGANFKNFATYSSYAAVAFSPDGSKLVAGAGSEVPSGGVHNIVLWDVASGDDLWHAPNHDANIRSVSFSKDGKTILSGAMDWTVKLTDAATGKELASQREHGFVFTAAFSPDTKTVLSGGVDGVVRERSAEKLDLLREFRSNFANAPDMLLMPDGNTALFKVQTAEHLSSNQLKVWNLQDGRSSRRITWPEASVPGYATDLEKKHAVKTIDVMNSSPDGKFILGVSNQGDWRANSIQNYIVWDYASGKPLHEFARKYEGEGIMVNWVNCAAITPDNKAIAIGEKCGLVKLVGIAEENIVCTFEGHTDAVTVLAVSPDGKLIASGSKDNTVKLWDVAGRRALFTLSGHAGQIEDLTFSPDGKQLLTASRDRSLILWDVASGRQIRLLEAHLDQVFKCAFSADGKTILSGERSGVIRMWDAASGKVLKVLSGHTSDVSYLAFLPGATHAISCSYDNTVRIWNLQTGQWTAFVMNSDETQWIVFNSDGYWDASPNGGELVAMSQGMQCWNIDQFAVQNNRPDLILKNLPNPDQTLIAHFYHQYQKRLRKLGIAENSQGVEYHIPQASITEAAQNGNMVALKFRVSDTKYRLRHYNVYINNVPLFGALGKSVEGSAADIAETIELTPGQNKIEVSCMNEKGVESYRALVYRTFEGRVAQNLYVLAFGVSEYENKAYDLQFADKDAKDLVKACKDLGGYANVYTKLVTNDDVTPEAIKEAKAFVKDARPEDAFVLFIAGHGMHDRDADATYYYLTSNADVNNLKATAADFESIEDLLQGIAPRNKLFLMDACESGELDDEETAATGVSVAAAQGLKSRGMKHAVLSAATPAGSVPSLSVRTLAALKDRYIYNDIVRRSGAVVFSSSKGTELSYERSDIENGLFTSAILKALAGGMGADKNYDGVLSTDELRDFVNAAVAKESGDMQHPTIDRDNIYQKIGIRLR